MEGARFKKHKVHRFTFYRQQRRYSQEQCIVLCHRKYAKLEHTFCGQEREVWQSIPMERIAWAVGHFYTAKKGAASYYKMCTNANSVSIEMCDCLKNVGWDQMLAVRELVQYIQKKCPNAKTIIRHWDVNGKECPKPMIGSNNKKWKHLHSKIVNNYQYKAKVVITAAIRSSKGVKKITRLEVLNMEKF